MEGREREPVGGGGGGGYMFSSLLFTVYPLAFPIR